VNVEVISAVIVVMSVVMAIASVLAVINSGSKSSSDR